MKKCFIMFLFFVLMLLIAALTEMTPGIIQDNQGIEFANADLPLSGGEVGNNLGTD